MLYDQGQLLVAYAQAYQATKEDKYREVINGILKYVTRDLRHEKGMIFHEYLNESALRNRKND